MTRLRNPRNKYNAGATIHNGERFDSGAERTRYLELLLLQRANVIARLERQPKFVLQPAFHDAWGRLWRAITYTADFSYYDKDGQMTIEDMKGAESRDFRLRAKMFQAQHPDIKLVITRAK